MLFVAGPRQVGKTTVALASQELSPYFYYLNYDVQDHRQRILAGPNSVATHCELDRLRDTKSIVVFDELHKYARWKEFLKGFFDQYQAQVFIIVTGSSRLDVFKKGGDSLMGRYFHYRLHPLSIREIIGQSDDATPIQTPLPISKSNFDSLLEFGGFPEPYLKADPRFSNRWQKLRLQQLFYEDLRDFTRVQEVRQVETLAELIRLQAGQLLTYSGLANKINASVDSVMRWINVLESTYFLFSVRPWSKNVTRSLLKEPKYYVWDWSLITDPGARYENFVAVHLLKAVQFWSDSGLGNFSLHFLRDKEQREVDFLVVKDENPWFLVEVKASVNASMTKSLFHFQSETTAAHAFQVAFDMDYVNQDCFQCTSPIKVPVQTLLSQLV